jgi:hypothetical protein
MVNDAALEYGILARPVRQHLDGGRPVPPPPVADGAEDRVDGRKIEACAPDRQARGDKPLGHADDERAEIVMHGRMAQDPIDQIVGGPRARPRGVLCSIEHGGDISLLAKPAMTGPALG